MAQFGAILFYCDTKPSHTLTRDKYMQTRTLQCSGAKQVWTCSPSALLWEEHEAAEDAVCLRATVDAAPGRVSAHRDLVALGQAEDAAA